MQTHKMCSIDFSLNNEQLFQKLLDQEVFNAAIILVRSYPTIAWYLYINTKTPFWVINLFYRYSEHVIELPNVGFWLKIFVQINYPNVDQLAFGFKFSSRLIVEGLTSNLLVLPKGRNAVSYGAWCNIIKKHGKASDVIFLLLNDHSYDLQHVATIILDLIPYEITSKMIFKIFEVGIGLIELLLKNKEYCQCFSDNKYLSYLIKNKKLFNVFEFIHNNYLMFFFSKGMILFSTNDQEEQIRRKKIFILSRAIKFDNIQIFMLYQTFMNAKTKAYICKYGHAAIVFYYKNELLTKENILNLCRRGHFVSLKILLNCLEQRQMICNTLGDIYSNRYCTTYGYIRQGVFNRLVSKDELLTEAVSIEDATERKHTIMYVGGKICLNGFFKLLKAHDFSSCDALHKEDLLPDDAIMLWEKNIDYDIMVYLLDIKMYPSHSFIHDKMDDNDFWIKCFELGLCDNCCTVYAAIKTIKLYPLLSEFYGVLRENELCRALLQLSFRTGREGCYADSDNRHDVDNLTDFIRKLNIRKVKHPHNLFKLVNSIYSDIIEASYIVLVIIDHIMQYNTKMGDTKLVIEKDDMDVIQRDLLNYENVLKNERLMYVAPTLFPSCKILVNDVTRTYISTFDVPLLKHLVKFGCIDSSQLLHMEEANGEI